MTNQLDKNEALLNAKNIQSAISALVPGDKTFRDKAGEISQQFKTLKLLREDREVLWGKFNSLYLEHKTKQEAFRSKQKENAEQIEREIKAIPEYQDGVFAIENPWTKIREVSQLFKTLKLSRDDREKLWAEFNIKCDGVKKRESDQKQSKEYTSGKYRDEITEILGSSVYNIKASGLLTVVDNVGKFALACATVGVSALVVERTKVDDVTNEYLLEMNTAMNQVCTILSEHKLEMTHEHKQECFNAIKEAREFLDEQWAEFKKKKADEHATRQAEREEKQAKHNEWRNRTLANVEANREKHQKATEQLSRMEDHLSELQDKLCDAKPGNYYDRVSVWISESEDQIESKKQWIQKLEDWIEEGEEKLRN